MLGALLQRRRHWFKVISAIVICLFFLNDMSFGIGALQTTSNSHTLSVPSRFNDISLNVPKTIPQDTEDPSLAEALEEEASLTYVSHLMGKILSGWGSVMSERPIKDIIARHLGDKNIKWTDIRKEGKTFCLSYEKADGEEITLRYFTPKDYPEEAMEKESVSVGEGDVRLIVEKVMTKKEEVLEGDPANVSRTEVREGIRQDSKRRKQQITREDLFVEVEDKKAAVIPKELEEYLDGKELVDSVFEGGGAKGVVYAGALEEFASRNIWFRKVAGTSAGAIVACLIAAGYTHEEVKKIIFETDFNQFKDWRWGFLPPVINLALFGGLYWGRAFEKWIEGKLEAKLGYVPTMKDLPIPLAVVASDLTDKRILTLNRKTAPDLRVAEAVRMSMGIPFFFNVHRWHGEYEGVTKTRHVVDGGILRNIDLDVFRKEHKEHYKVFGFTLHEIEDKGKKKSIISKVVELAEEIPLIRILVAVVGYALNADNNAQLADDTWARIVDIPVDVGTTEFDLSLEKKEELEEWGRKATAKVLDEDMADPFQGYEAVSLDPDEQKVQDLIDGLVVMAVEADLNNNKVILGLDTSLIPDVQKSTSAMNNLLKVLRDMQMKNVIVCQADGAALYGEIEKVREEGDISKSNIVIVGEKEILSSGAFDALKAENEEEVGAYFAEVIVPEGFPDDGDTELISIIAQAIQEASKGERASRRKEFLLKAEPMGIDKLVDKLERQTERFSA